jgi:hypothetical protein
MFGLLWEWSRRVFESLYSHIAPFPAGVKMAFSRSRWDRDMAHQWPDCWWYRKYA